MPVSLSSLQQAQMGHANRNTSFLGSERTDVIMIGDNLHNKLQLDRPNLTATNLSTHATNNITANWSFGFSVTMATILSISSFVTIVGNLMVLTVIYRHRGMRTRTNLFLVNLAIADFLVGLTLVPFSITTLIQGDWVFGDAFCSVNGWFNALCLITSIHTLMYISINKYYSIIHPLNNPIKLWHIVAMMVAAWIWGALCATLTVTGLHSVTFKNGTSQCGPKYPKDNKGYALHGLIQITDIIIPFCILVFCYIKMFREIKRHSKRLRDNSTMEEDVIIAQQKKVTITLFIVLATFIVMALPYHLYATYTTIAVDKTKFLPEMNPIAYCFLYLNSMCNPIIYAFRSPAFREGYKEILCQTPNYVIRDDADNRGSRRFSSFSLRSRRAISQSSCGEAISPLSPVPLLSPPAGGSRAKSILTKQKGLKKMIRSSRKSTTPSIIRRDGEVIIIKQGKIVSVRRESDGVMSPGSRVVEAPFSNSVAHAVISGLMINATKDEEDKEKIVSSTQNKDNGAITHSMNIKERDENGECEVFISETSKADSPDYSDKNSHSDFCTIIIDKPDDKDATSEGSNDFKCFDSIEELSSSAQHSKNKSIKERRNAPNLTVDLDSVAGSTFPRAQPINLIHSSNNSKQSCIPLPTVSNLFVGATATTTDILLGMPLSPHTRNVLAKSDMQLNNNSSPESRQRLAARPITHAKSSENLYRRPMRRLPSLEYLDPPENWNKDFKLSPRKNNR